MSKPPKIRSNRADRMAEVLATCCLDPSSAARKWAVPASVSALVHQTWWTLEEATTVVRSVFAKANPAEVLDAIGIIGRDKRGPRPRWLLAEADGHLYRVNPYSFDAWMRGFAPRPERSSRCSRCERNIDGPTRRHSRSGLPHTPEECDEYIVDGVLSS